jgi:hypothetical protein
MLTLVSGVRVRVRIRVKVRFRARVRIRVRVRVDLGSPLASLFISPILILSLYQ